MSKNLKQFTDKNFQKEVLDSNKPVLVDFWAPWCGPCRMITPVLEELANETKELDVNIGKLNVDENTTTAGDFKVRSIPTLMLFKNGKAVETIVGLRGKDELRSIIDKHQ